MDEGDPFYDVRRDIETSIEHAQSLLDSYERISSTSKAGAELGDAQRELDDALHLIQTDIEDLEESVEVVEREGAGWTIDSEEVGKRRQILQELKNRAGRLRDSVESSHARTTGAPTKRPAQSYGNLEAGLDIDDDVDDEDFSRAYESQQVEEHFAHQDSLLEKIAKSVGILREQAGIIGAETLEQNSMLDSLGAGVDRTQDRLGRGMSKLKDFVRRNNDGPQGWCVLFLIIILTMLLLAVILI